MANPRLYRFSVGCHDDWIGLNVHAASPDEALQATRRVLGVPLEVWDKPSGMDVIRVRIANAAGRYCTAYCPPDCPGPGESSDAPMPLPPRPDHADADLRTSRQLAQIRQLRQQCKDPVIKQGLAARINAAMVPPWADFTVIDAMIVRFLADYRPAADQAAQLHASADLLESRAQRVCRAPAKQRPELLEAMAWAVPIAQRKAHAPDLPVIGRRLELMYDDIGHAAEQWATHLRYLQAQA